MLLAMRPSGSMLSRLRSLEGAQGRHHMLTASMKRRPRCPCLQLQRHQLSSDGLLQHQLPKQKTRNYPDFELTFLMLNFAAAADQSFVFCRRQFNSAKTPLSSHVKILKVTAASVDVQV